LIELQSEAADEEGSRLDCAALLAGLCVLLPMLELLEEHDVSKLRRRAQMFFKSAWKDEAHAKP
jgi:hypothetical protein